MTARVSNITFFAENPGELARFWCAVMGYPAWSSWPDDEFAIMMRDPEGNEFCLQ